MNQLVLDQCVDCKVELHTGIMNRESYCGICPKCNEIMFAIPADKFIKLVEDNPPPKGRKEMMIELVRRN